MTTERPERDVRRLSTPRAAGLAGVLFAVLFGVAIALIHTALPEGAQPGAQWVEGSEGKVRAAAVLMPFAGICFLWFIGVVRDGLGRYEDKFFASVFLGSGLLFLAMIFVSSAVGVALVASRGADYGADVHVFGQALLIALSKTYALRMAAVFMMSLATIWLKTGLVSRGLVIFTYVVALTLLVASDVSVWLTLAFPVWVLIVSVLALSKAGLIDLHRDGD
ncbi:MULTISPECIES: hypothetical protein [Mycolicibacterium]|uniref:hypothetical protein n=1 Tax=Mycolicibacterium TaxID=1866885 RepID=UPI0004B38D80|nr:MULTISPECIES: hypothetical protein [Mycolicibacterium]MDM2172637.1 hypothetical protein [Mycobacteroides abscessus]MDM2176427.1 hypothetical protein [Mycobacteroides abscessus]MDM2204992.1 hypothetical protein [Mycobacteroides abscessus]MDM2210577.1 hypothetical protein [Mycobacteroides abscessus]MDM2215891.1 hypothetical protein [Mycobacteroides abscessus]